jgi:hypothetical protein
MCCPAPTCFKLVFLFAFLAVLIPFTFASGPYQVGSANTVTADPLVTRPSTTPCVVQLFSNAQFFDFNNEDFTFTPPSDCPGPWAKVVFETDISVQAGIQYDRTANYWLGPYNIYFGTTAEPSAIGPTGTSKKTSPITVRSSPPRRAAWLPSATPCAAD